MSVEIHIDRLSFEGLTAEASAREARAFAAELEGLLDRFGLPEGRVAQDLSRIDLGSLPRHMSRPEAMGAELARALYAELEK